MSESFARAQWPNQNPLGKQLGGGAQKDTVIGVAGDAHINALSDDDAAEQYWPASASQMPEMTLVVGTAGAFETFPTLARSISASLDPSLFLEIRKIKLLFADNVRDIERVAGTTTLIGLVALALASVGLIGLMSFTVRQKTKDIAIRLALGAEAANVLRPLLAQFLWPVAIGLVAGAAIAAAVSALLRVALYGVSNLDPLSYLLALAFLIAILALALLLPARRALRINVSRALHYE